MGLQRARVPASRDVTEKIHAEGVMAVARQLDAKGSCRRSLRVLKTFLTMLK